jgi:hypothetical protein
MQREFLHKLYRPPNQLLPFPKGGWEGLSWATTQPIDSPSFLPPKPPHRHYRKHHRESQHHRNRLDRLTNA